jgi:hypothetical protein
MKIICETQEEYDTLMKASKYLHDLQWEERKMFKKEYHSLDMDNDVINFLCHVYLSKADFPNKDEVILKQFNPNPHNI